MFYIIFLAGKETPFCWGTTISHHITNCMVCFGPCGSRMLNSVDGKVGTSGHGLQGVQAEGPWQLQ